MIWPTRRIKEWIFEIVITCLDIEFLRGGHFAEESDILAIAAVGYKSGLKQKLRDWWLRRALHKLVKEGRLICRSRRNTDYGSLDFPTYESGSNWQRRYALEWDKR